MIKWFYHAGKFITGLLFRFWFNIEFVGAENQPKEGGYILCCNHRTAVDPLIIAQKIRNPICFLSKAELFENRFIAAVLKALGAIPVARGSGDMSAINEAVKLTKEGYVLGIFPEGTRSKTDELLRFKSGAVVIAAQSGGDLLPASIWYSGRSFRSKVVVRYGKVIPNSQFAIDGISGRQIKAAVGLIKNEVENLLEETKRCR
ncbi:MAG: 1-acyl-sn-glycerol-3-phosphate acyltransferase [Oscillospiraceae bacterium]|nr:1-acyl-sn-glycerol-3-phosphate acyltransferase [Oscillospiraceae bacterium]MBQ7082347.1 1-acyl-sn-glycerol-3-phosphate acyltransferase [Oscillospiraceae bacterium]MBR2635951.1 1-acyl-sn-glycerol-3-phosphate acyltransferase [Oscillospiraceae bacterium]